MIRKPVSHGGISNEGAVNGLISWFIDLYFFIFSIHCKPKAKVGGDATPKGILRKFGGFWSIHFVLNTIGSSGRLCSGGI